MSELVGNRMNGPNPVERLIHAEMWTVVHAPGAAVQAIATKAATPGVKHVCYGIIATIACGVTAQTPINVQILDGATVVFSAAVSAPVNQCAAIFIEELYIAGTAGNSMTLQFSGAGVAASVENVTLIGFDVQ